MNIGRLISDVNSFTGNMLETEVINCMHCTFSKFSPVVQKDLIDTFEQIRYGPLEHIPYRIEEYNIILAMVPVQLPYGYCDHVGFVAFYKVLLICCLVRWNNPYVAIKIV